MTRLIEFKNRKKEILRGLFDKANSRNGVVFVHGFERTMVEKKFKNIVDELMGKINLFRFDFSGCGISDGKFDDLTVAKLAEEIKIAIGVFKKQAPKMENISLAAHSLGACAALKFIFENPEKISKAVFFGPAFNQKELLRYYFAKKKNPDTKWESYGKYFSEKEFQNDIKIKKRMIKDHWISNKYYLENEIADYQDLFKKLDFKNILIILGKNDEKVPQNSNNKLPEKIKKIIVENGDHDFSRPDMVGQYLKQVIGFLK